MSEFVRFNKLSELQTDSWRRQVHLITPINSSINTANEHTGEQVKLHSLVFLERQPHVLLHLLQAVVVGVNEVKGQRTGEWTASSARGHAEEPATHI